MQKLCYQLDQLTTLLHIALALTIKVKYITPVQSHICQSHLSFQIWNNLPHELKLSTCTATQMIAKKIFYSTLHTAQSDYVMRLQSTVSDTSIRCVTYNFRRTTSTNVM